MKSKDFLKESSVTIADDAMNMHKDHEVQMAREECYNIASNAIQLHKLLKNVNETVGIDAWASEKISLANDYIRTVREWLEYELMDGKFTDTFETLDMIGESDGGSTSSSAIATSIAVPAKPKKVIKRTKNV